MRHRTAALGGRRLVAPLLVLALLAPAAAARGAGPAVAADSGGAAYVDPALTFALGAGPSAAILSWDRAATSRAAVAAHLASLRLDHTVATHLSMAFACASSRTDLERLAAIPGVVSVWGDQRLEPTLDRSVPTVMNGDPKAVWSGMGITGKGVGIAVLDTGIDARHPDLAWGKRTLVNARSILSPDEIGSPENPNCNLPFVFDEDVEDSETTSGHGTHLASVAAGDGTASGGKLKGVAPGADLIGVNVVESVTPEVKRNSVEGVDPGTGLSLIRFMAGLEYVLRRTLENGPTTAKVVLLGWSAKGLWDPWHPHYLAVRDLHDYGMSVVMPVGNGGPGASVCDQPETCRFNPLAIGKYVIAVGGTPKESRTQLEPYSSRGDPVERTSREEPVRYEPTVVAPGTHVVAARRPGLVTYSPPLPTTYPLQGYGAGAADDPTNLAYQALTGTSVSAAHVAGAVALLQQSFLARTGCFLTPGQVRDALMATATPLPGYARHEVGAGAVDATAALAAVAKLKPVLNPDPWMCPPQ